MTMDVTANKQEAALPVEGPGRLLREAREALNLSQDEIARRLHLDLKMVKALESDDYKKLPPPIFVTGYLRNYARLTNLPADELIASYNRATGAQPPPIKVMAPSTQGAEHRSDRPVQLTTYVMALAVLVVVLGLWWWQGRDESEVMTAGLSESAPAGTDTGIDVAPVPLQQPEGGSTELIPVPIPGGNVPSGAAGESAARGLMPVPVPELPAPFPGAAPGLNQSNPLAPLALSANGAGAASPASPAPIIPAVIKLTFEADSWVQITDANGQRLFYDLGKEGVTRTLQGVPPLQVVIGYSPGVKIEYNGVPFNHSRFEQGGRASFVLGKAAGAN